MYIQDEKKRKDLATIYQNVAWNLIQNGTEAWADKLTKRSEKNGLRMKDPYKHRNLQYCRNSTVDAYRKDRLFNKRF